MKVIKVCQKNMYFFIDSAILTCAGNRQAGVPVLYSAKVIEATVLPWEGGSFSPTLV